MAPLEWICACRTQGRINAAQPIGRNQQVRRTLLWHQRCTEGTKPTARGLATLAIKQASFSAQRNRETARRPRRRTVWRFARSSIGPCAKRHTVFLRVLARPPCSSVLKNLLPCLGLAGRTQHRWVSDGQREDACISRGEAPRASPGGSSHDSMHYRRFAENPAARRDF